MRLLAAALFLAAPALSQTAPEGHRLFLAPTARPAGGVTVGLTQLAIPTAAVGVGGGVSLGAGVVAAPTPELAGVLFVEPKWTVWGRPGAAVALGVAARANPFQNGAVHAVPYVVATAGRGRVAGTLGVGGRLNVERGPDGWWTALRNTAPTVCCADVRPVDSRRRASLVCAPAAFAGLEVRALDRWTWMLEATVLPDQEWTARYENPAAAEYGQSVRLVRGPVHYDAAVAAGARVTTGRTAVDFGLVLGRDADGAGTTVPGVAPWLSATVALGR
jgi:hypothetical protein